MEHKSEDSSFFGYKTHIAMSDERIITAATVASGDKGDGPQLPELIEQSRTNGMEVESVIGDTAYSGKDNIILVQNEEKCFELVVKLHPTDFHKMEAFKENPGSDIKIEAKNAELKNVFGCDRADSYGLDCMRMQGALTIFVTNIKRIFKLV